MFFLCDDKIDLIDELNNVLFKNILNTIEIINKLKEFSNNEDVLIDLNKSDDNDNSNILYSKYIRTGDDVAESVRIYDFLKNELCGKSLNYDKLEFVFEYSDDRSVVNKKSVLITTVIVEYLENDDGMIVKRVVFKG